MRTCANGMLPAVLHNGWLRSVFEKAAPGIQENSTMRRRLQLIALLVGSSVISWHPLVSTFRLALENGEYTYILLILPLTLSFIFADWRTLQRVIKPGVGWGTFMLCMVGMIAVLARWRTIRMISDVQLSIKILVLVTWWIGSFISCFGARVSRSLLFPLCFLYWMVPLPSFVLNEITKSLQQGSALATQLLFKSAGVPVAQDGLMLSIPGLTVEVAKECSSIRSSLMLLVTTMVLAQLLLHSTWRKSLVVMLAVPLSVAKNGLRIFTIAMLGTRVDRGFLDGRLHHDGGIVFFAIALCIIFFLLWILRRTERDVTKLSVPRPVRSEALTTVCDR
jgi:exosortase